MLWTQQVDNSLEPKTQWHWKSPADLLVAAQVAAGPAKEQQEGGTKKTYHIGESKACMYHFGTCTIEAHSVTSTLTCLCRCALAAEPACMHHCLVLTL